MISLDFNDFKIRMYFRVVQKILILKVYLKECVSTQDKGLQAHNWQRLT